MFDKLKASEKILAVFFILLIVMLIFVYSLKIIKNPDEFKFRKGSENAERIDNATPASQYCIQEGNYLEIIGDEKYCVLPSGKRCEEWNYFRGICNG